MHKYQVAFSTALYYSIIVEAESAEEAKNIALGYSIFDTPERYEDIELDNCDIDYVTEIEEE